MDSIKNRVIGGIITVIIGGTGFAVSQNDLAKNFSTQSGMSQSQAEQYIKDSQGKLQSFDSVGQILVDDGIASYTAANGMDCLKYSYGWEDATLTCNKGKAQLYTYGQNESQLGNCYKSLSTDLGAQVKAKIQECINLSDNLLQSYESSVLTKVLDATQISESKNSIIYNKSVLMTALQSK